MEYLCFSQDQLLSSLSSCSEGWEWIHWDSLKWGRLKKWEDLVVGSVSTGLGRKNNTTMLMEGSISSSSKLPNTCTLSLHRRSKPLVVLPPHRIPQKRSYHQNLNCLIKDYCIIDQKGGQNKDYCIIDQKGDLLAPKFLTDASKLLMQSYSV